MASIADIKRITPESLKEIILAEASIPEPSYAVIDVRDDDHIGGHIKDSINIPSQTLDAQLPTLLRKLEGKRTVVFHCALSQQRGPSAALQYLREVQRAKEAEAANTQSDGAAEEAQRAGKAADALERGEQEAGDDGAALVVEKKGGEEGKGQKIFVLDRGFVGWQEVFGEDERLTTGYRKELWKDGYLG